MNSNHNQNPCNSLQGCNCNCGTRICLDQQIINQRQEWKQKYFCLQKQTIKDVGLLKQKIYQQCSTLMQNQFNKKQISHSDSLNKKNLEIQQLTAKIIKLESSFKISEKEKELLKIKLTEEQQKYSKKLEQINELKQKHLRNINQTQQQNLSETGALKAKINDQHQEILKKIQAQNQHLKHKVKQFEKKYQLIIPEVEKLKVLVNKKTFEIEGLSQQLEKTKQAKDKQILAQKKKMQELIEINAPFLPKINQLNQIITDLQNQLAKAKIVKRQVKVQPVFVDRPVEVQRVVERIIEVERIVKQYIQPDFDFKKHEEQNKKLRSQLQSIIHELHHFQSRYEQTLKQHEITVAAYDQNILKYKSQRDGLVKRIHEQDEQLQKIYNLIQNQPVQQSSNPQKIVVQVNKDGTVNKRIQKINIEERVKVQTAGQASNLKGQKQPIVEPKDRVTQYSRATRTVTQAVGTRKK